MYITRAVQNTECILLEQGKIQNVYIPGKVSFLGKQRVIHLCLAVNT